ncbi:feruloyl-CoA synthase [Rhodocytophaga rosea]|uniref:Feruloyl-CoA synthase n=1 Tax=Rhodocytophaga rosea TaxID=2704465 RepID=A0A6C0GCR9_9BACT|nr:feruloyl-CoA synthase [Rhodocytophaga rosea]QHT65480.1 feruloyl-CoA synthase [Rhodocytophaga rosea]
MIVQHHLKDTPYRKVPFGEVSIDKTVKADGSLLLKSNIPLQAHPHRMTERLLHWAEHRSNQVFIGQRDTAGIWWTYTYQQTLTIVRSIAQYLLNANLSEKRPIAILSENSVEHAMVALAALHVGIPYSPITPAYSLRSKDFEKLKHVINLLTPGLIFVSDGKKYERALQAVAGDAEVVIVNYRPDNIHATLYQDIVKTTPTVSVDRAYQAIMPETIAKILFTSGSTGLPKGVINTHGNISTNWQQITQTFPFMADAFEIIDWLPWNHTFGGNHNFGLTLYNGGTMYLDEGNPTPAGIKATVANLREISPTVYFNVPKGFGELIGYLRKDRSLREKFFSRLQLLFYAGAGMPQHVWDALESLALETVGERIIIATGLGCTESSPSALFSTRPDGFAGLLGLPVPGLELKLVPVDGKLEARYKGGNITQGYWKNEQASRQAYDEEGFYKSGDALKFVDPDHVEEGLLFDGRLAEDFKLDTGTWVNVGKLRTDLLAAGNGLIHDAVITGHDQQFVGAIIFPDIEVCKKQLRLSSDTNLQEIVANPSFKQVMHGVLTVLAKRNTGSTTLIKRALLADFTLSLDAGELTDKGSVNQKQVLKNYPECIRLLYQPALTSLVLEANP